MNIHDLNSLIQVDYRVRPKRLDEKNTMALKPIECDTFEKTQKENNTVEIEFNHLSAKTKMPKRIRAFQNPSDKGIVYKKVVNKETGKTEKIPLIVDIAESKDGISTSYYFLDPKTKEEIGFVIIDDWRKKIFDITDTHKFEDTRLLDDFPTLGVEGDRISIDYLQNNDEEKYCGIGKLSDQIAVEYCINEGIKPNILSLAETNSHAAHYKRGRRFLPVDKYDKDLDYYDFVKEYGTDDPNKIIEERIAATPEGQKVDTSDLYGLYMYMPSEIINLYLEMIKKHPVLHKEK